MADLQSILQGLKAEVGGASHGAGSDEAELLQLLTQGAEDRGRSSLLMKRAAHGPPVPSSLPGLDAEQQDRLKALAILQGVFGGGPGLPAGVSISEPLPTFDDPRKLYDDVVGITARADAKMDAPHASHGTAEPDTRDMAELDMADHLARDPRDEGLQDNSREFHVRVTGLPQPVLLTEVLDSEAATESYRSRGEKDPFGSMTWPTSYVIARRLLAEGVRGKTVLELGCGTGLASLAASLGGASFVLATDRAQQNLDRVLASAERNATGVCAELFDVLLKLPLPSSASPLCGSLQGPPHRPACHAKLPRCFDFVVFSDVLYWPEEAEAFGRRAAEAFANGSTVIVADPGRRKEDFLRGIRSALSERGVPLPSLELKPSPLSPEMLSWASKEVKTASQLFCKEPFELVLRPVQAQQPATEEFELVD